MSNKTITTNMLTPDAVFMVTGRVSFSRVSRQIDGEALKKDIEQKRRQGHSVIERPYTTITIHDAQVKFADPAAATDPSKRRIEESYAMENLYNSTMAKNTGMCFSAKNTSKNLPWIGSRDASNPNNIIQFAPEGELAVDLMVTLDMRVFKSAKNNGVSLRGIIVEEPVRYYTNVDLSAYGLTFEAAAVVPPATGPIPDDGYREPGAPVAPATGDPYSSQPAPVAPVPGAPTVPPPTGYTPPAAPTGYPGYPVPPAPGTAPQAPAAPAPGPYGQGSGQPQGGIRYDPGADASRQY